MEQQSKEISATPQPICLKCANTVIFPEASIRNPQNDPNAIKLGAHLYCRGDLYVFKEGKIEIGDWCYIGEGTKIWAADSIRIGNRVLISHNVNIFDSDTHPIDDYKARHEQFVNIVTNGNHWHEKIARAPVEIGDDVLICAHVTILKGVKIGKGAVVGAGAVVTHNVPPLTLVAGNPAKTIRKLVPPQE